MKKKNKISIPILYIPNKNELKEKKEQKTCVTCCVNYTKEVITKEKGNIRTIDILRTFVCPKTRWQNIDLISTDQSPACLTDRPAAFVFSSNSLVWLIFYACGYVYVRLLPILWVCASVAIYPPNLIFLQTIRSVVEHRKWKKHMCDHFWHLIKPPLPSLPSSNFVHLVKMRKYLYLYRWQLPLQTTPPPYDLNEQWRL